MLHSTRRLNARCLALWALCATTTLGTRLEAGGSLSAPLASDHEPQHAVPWMLQIDWSPGPPMTQPQCVAISLTAFLTACVPDLQVLEMGSSKQLFLEDHVIEELEAALAPGKWHELRHESGHLS